MSLRITASTDCGCRHEENQDFYRAGRLSDDTYWVVLCDGMGGVDNGGRASALAAEYLQQQITTRVADILTEQGIRDFMEQSAADANLVIYEESNKQGESSTMGTTLVMAIIRNNLVQIVHSGDSRAYVVTKSGIKQLTHDHSIVQELLDTGKITPEQALNHPNKNIITSALGVDVETRIDYDEYKLAKGDYFFACSDGLTNMVSESDIVSIIREKDFYDTAETMIRKAVEAGGFDNITAVVVGA